MVIKHILCNFRLNFVRRCTHSFLSYSFINYLRGWKFLFENIVPNLLNILNLRIIFIKNAK